MSNNASSFTFFINGNTIQAPLVNDQGQPTGELNDTALSVTVDDGDFLMPTLVVTNIPEDECPTSLIVGEVVEPGDPGHRGSAGMEIVNTIYRIHPLTTMNQPGVMMVGDLVMATDADETGVVHCYMPSGKGLVMNFVVVKAAAARHRFRHFAIGFERPSQKPWLMSIHEQEKTADVIDVTPRLRLATEPQP
ncbi:MAG: hypothetical protein NUV56_03170 [Candidatus Uhrbacteria bacterium]|nr:hypothetical protein [Candidatus Uhrbacteria bacterium]